MNKAISLYFPAQISKSQTKNIKLAAGNFDIVAGVKTLQQKLNTDFKSLDIPPEKINWLVRNYGLFAAQILNKSLEFHSENQGAENALLKAEVWFTITAEAATNLSDFLIRRTGKLYFEREQIAEILPLVAKTFQEFLGWNNDTLNFHLNEFNQQYEAAVAFKNE